MDGPPRLEELRKRGERLAAQLERDRAGDATDELLRQREWAWWRRGIRFPTTVRRFERVFALQGVPWGSRWRMAIGQAWVTVRGRTR